MQQVSLLILGYAAMAVSSAANIPQLVRVLRSDRGRLQAVSSGTHLLFMLSSVLWLTYAALTAQWPLLANCVVVLSSNALIFLRLRTPVFRCCVSD